MRILIRLVLIAAVAAVLWLGITTLQSKKQAELAAFASQTRPVTAVSAATVVRNSWQQYIPTIGNINAVQQVDVTSEVSGKITAIHFESGQRISQGQILVSLDASVVAAELQGLIAEQRLSELNFERTTKLFNEKTISKSEFDLAEARRDEAAAHVAAQRANIAQKVIRAPFSGRLGIRAIDVGQFLEPGMKIVALRTLNPIYVDFAVPEKYIRRIEIGQAIQFDVQAFPEENFQGTVDAIEPGVDINTRNVIIRAVAENGSEKLRPGMFAQIRLTTSTHKDLLTIPETAINYTPYGNSVFAIDKGDGGLTVQRVPIETGEIRGGQVEVKSGLVEGQQIVALGHNKLRNGMKVKIDHDVPLTATQ